MTYNYYAVGEIQGAENVDVGASILSDREPLVLRDQRIILDDSKRIILH